MAMITFHMQDGRKIEGNVPFNMMSVPSAGVSYVEIDHPQLKISLFGTAFFVLNEACVVANVGKAVYTLVGTYDGVTANGYMLRDADYREATVDLGRYAPATLELMMKTAA